VRVDELTVEIRNASLERVGVVTATELIGFEAVLRFNNVGTWTLKLPANHYLAESASAPGAGIVVTGPSGVLLSGPMTAVTLERNSADSAGTMTIEGTDDSVILAERLAYPTPATANVESQINPYDKRSGVASTVMRAYVNANIGPSAPTARRISNLTLATDPLAGSTVYGSARFDVLGQLLSNLAAVDGLGFDLVQQGENLEFRVYPPLDRTGEIRMDIANDTLSSSKFSYSSPGATLAIVAGEGTEADRVFRQVTTTEATEAGSAWGRRIESFIDQRSSADVNELTQAGLEKLADEGNTQVSLEVVPSSDLTMVYGVDWNLGDKVTVVVDSDELTSTVTSVALKIESDGVYVGATVGNPEGVDYQSRLNKRVVSSTQRLNDLERKEQLTTAPDPFPFAQAAGTVSVVLSASNFGNATINFPAGRFSQAPLVMATLNTSGVNQRKLRIQIGGITTTGANCVVSTGDGTNETVTVTVAWHALQMTSTTAAG